jgi:hypothetical protein
MSLLLSPLFAIHICIDKHESIETDIPAVVPETHYYLKGQLDQKRRMEIAPTTLHACKLINSKFSPATDKIR